tara:strand:+ start:62 stop:976 length:915 start_codon:yes stop_codon:yes gene_type:complete
MDDNDKKSKDFITPLILTKEINTQPNNNIEILKIKNLIKLKYLNSMKNLPLNNKNYLNKDLNFIKGAAKKIEYNIRKKTTSINESIKNKKIKLKRLYNEKELFNLNKIQSNIIYYQKILIDNLKQNTAEHKFNLNQLEKQLKESNNSNKNFETNNNELKNNLSHLITTNEKLKDTIKKINSQHKKASLSAEEKNELLTKIKFYQEENIRLSSELNSTQDKYKTIKNNFDEVELEKNKIYKQIKELNSSLIKTNVIGTPFVKDIFEEDSINSKVLSEISNTNLQEENKAKEKIKNLEDKISDIFE